MDMDSEMKDFEGRGIHFRVRDLEKTIESLMGKVSRLEFKMIELQSLQTKKVSKALQVTGSGAWEAYRTAFLARYRVEPVRNAKVNGQLLEIVKRLGAEDAPKVAAFYLGISDPQYLRLNHPVGTLLMNCESIHSMWKMGQTSTGGKGQAAVSSSQTYLQKKYGGDHGAR